MLSCELGVSKDTRQIVQNSTFFQTCAWISKCFFYFVFFLFCFEERRTIQNIVRKFKILQARHDYGHSLEETAPSLRFWNAHFAECASKFRREDKNYGKMRRCGKVFDVSHKHAFSTRAKFVYIIAYCTLTKKWNEEILIFIIYIELTKRN